MTKRIQNKITNRFDSISDPYGRKETRDSMVFDFVQNELSNPYADTQCFGVILMIETQGILGPDGSTLPTTPNPTHPFVITARVRPLEPMIEAQALDEPCKFKNDPTALYENLMQHPIAYSETLDGDESLFIPTVGDVVPIYYDLEGPTSQGKKRGLRFKMQRVRRAEGGFDATCLAALGTKLIDGKISLSRVGSPSSVIAGVAGGAIGGAAGGAGASSGAGPGNAQQVLVPFLDCKFATKGFQASTFGKGDRVKKKQIKHVVLHSTAGSTGNGKAKSTIGRFSRTPITTGFTDKSKPKGQRKKNPPCSDYAPGPPFDPHKMPHGTICRERKGRKGRPAKYTVEKRVQTSIHYACDQGGNIIQGLNERHRAYHAPGMNATAVGIEMCGDPGKGKGQGATAKYASMYNEKLLGACAKLVKDICKRHGLPISRDTIRGHEQSSKNRSDPGDKKNPGAWDWDDFLQRVKRA